MTDYDGNAFATRDLTDKVKQIIEIIPQCSEDAAVEALISCDEEVERSMMVLLAKIADGEAAAAAAAASSGSSNPKPAEVVSAPQEGYATVGRGGKVKKAKRAAPEPEQQVEAVAAAPEEPAAPTQANSAPAKAAIAAPAAGSTAKTATDGWGDEDTSAAAVAAAAAQEQQEQAAAKSAEPKLSKAEQEKKEREEAERAAKQAEEDEINAMFPKSDFEDKEEDFLPLMKQSEGDKHFARKVESLAHFKTVAKDSRAPTKPEKELLKANKKIQDIVKIEERLAKGEKVDKLQQAKADPEKKAALVAEVEKLQPVVTEGLEAEAKKLLEEHKQQEDKRVKKERAAMKKQRQAAGARRLAAIEGEKQRRVELKKAEEEAARQRALEEERKRQEIAAEAEKRRIEQEEEKKRRVEEARQRQEEEDRKKQAAAEEARRQKEEADQRAAAERRRHNYIANASANAAMPPQGGRGQFTQPNFGSAPGPDFGRNAPAAAPGQFTNTFGNAPGAAPAQLPQQTLRQPDNNSPDKQAGDDWGAQPSTEIMKQQQAARAGDLGDMNGTAAGAANGLPNGAAPNGAALPNGTEGSPDLNNRDQNLNTHNGYTNAGPGPQGYPAPRGDADGNWRDNMGSGPQNGGRGFSNNRGYGYNAGYGNGGYGGYSGYGGGYGGYGKKGGKKGGKGKDMGYGGYGSYGKGAPADFSRGPGSYGAMPPAGGKGFDNGAPATSGGSELPPPAATKPMYTAPIGGEPAPAQPF